jgi:hypothetical protein
VEVEVVEVKRHIARLGGGDGEAPVRGRARKKGKGRREVGRWCIESRTFRLGALLDVAFLDVLVYFAAFRRFVG